MKLKRVFLRYRKVLRKILIVGKQFLKDIADTSFIHGINYLADPERHIMEKVFWLVMIILAIYGSYFVCMTQYKRYQANPTVASLDRDYQWWNGTVPGATLCFENRINLTKADRFILKTWNTTSVDEEYTYYQGFLQAVINSTASDYEAIVDFAEDERFANIDLFEVAMTLGVSHDHQFSVNAAKSRLKIRIERIMTERGMCYGINAPMSQILKGRKPKVDKYRKAISCRYEELECHLKLDIFETTGMIEIHSPYEVSVTDGVVINLQKYEDISVSYKVTETVASDSLRGLTPSQRKCVFQDENTSDLQIYSITLCLMKCRATMALEMCNCIPLFYAFVDGPSCNPAGYECLLDFKWPVWALHICKCPSTCTEIKYAVNSMTKRIKHIQSGKRSNATSSFRWETLQPKTRIRRDILFSFEDLVVSFGGAAALFLGISFNSVISVIEVILNYIWLALKAVILVIRQRVRLQARNKL